jgi:Protein of unknown function (DUF2950)
MENEIMNTKNLITPTSSRPGPNRVAALSVLALLVAGISQLSFAQKSGSETFSSPWKASSALFQAVQNSDEEALERILGAGKEVTSSSDEIEDKLERERFSEKYQEMHRMVREPDGTTVLYIGAENWPFPIPLVSKNGVWFFNSDTGKEEILFRTVGENEITALQVCHVLAQGKERGNTAASDPIIEYAQSLVNSGATTSDNAAREEANQSASFRGYYFRTVTGNTVPRGLAVVAYPADYRSTGVMTFIVTKNGKVYEKDLGPKTTTLAKDIKRGPDSTWHPAE